MADDGYRSLGNGWKWNGALGFKRDLPPPRDRWTPQDRLIASGGAGGRISVTPNPGAKAGPAWYEMPALSMVAKNDRPVTEAASKYGLNPDLIRAIMYVESTRGQYDAIASLFDANKSILPMNVNTSYWGDQWRARDRLKAAPANVDAGAKMLQAISNAMPGASTAQIATIYNRSNAKAVNDYGARVQAVQKEKTWLPIKPARAPAAPGKYRNTPG